MKLYWAGILLCATATVSASFPCSAETSDEQSTAAEVNAPIVTALAPTDQIITTQSSAVAAESTPDSGVASNVVPLAGYVKQHKQHPFLSLLKQEFNSPIHTITTNNRDY